MKYVDGNYYVEVKDHRYIFHPTEIMILRLRDEPKSLRTQYQVQNKTQRRRNQEVIKNDNDQLVVKNYPKNKKTVIQNQQQILNHQIAHPANKINGRNFIKDTIVVIVNT